MAAAFNEFNDQLTSNSSDQNSRAHLKLSKETSFVPLKCRRNDITLKIAANAQFNQPWFNHSLLRKRELGLSNRFLVDSCARGFAPWRSWTGASKAVLSVAWSPKIDDGIFAACASTDHRHPRDHPYNKANNLLFGNINKARSYLKNLSGHFVIDDHSKTTIHKTVSQVAFAHQHRKLFSAGYDKTVRVWDLSATQNSNSRCRFILPHTDEVDLLTQIPAKSADQPLALATGQQSLNASIQIFFVLDDDENGVSCEGPTLVKPETIFASDRAKKHNIFPSSMEIGPDPYNNHYLLAGFAERSSDPNKADKQGHVCLWDIVTSRKLLKLSSVDDNCFDVAWATGCNIFAAASTTIRSSGQLTYRGLTKSVIKIWSPKETSGRVREMECPARDINDVKFHPSDENIITASCTDGRVYFWDSRKEDQILLALEHDYPIEQYNDELTLEEQDDGVRFTSWHNSGRFLYTGSSDGRIGCWNVLVSPVDALVQEVAQFDSGVMAGSFSPDGSKLLVGTVKGSVEILSIGAGGSETDDGVDTFVAPTEKSGAFSEYPASDTYTGSTSDEFLGIRAANRYLLTKQLVRHSKYGIGQGPNYQGPWNMSARRPESSMSVNNYMPGVAAQQFDRVTRSDGERRGGYTSEAAKRCRREAAAMEKQYQEIRKQCGPVINKSPRSLSSSSFGSIASSTELIASPSPSLSPANVTMNGSRMMNEDVQRSGVSATGKRQRVEDQRYTRPRSKRSRQTSPISHEIIDLDSYMVSSFDGATTGIYSDRENTPQSGIDASDSVYSPPAVFTPRKAGRNGFIIPPRAMPSSPTQPERRL